MLRIWVPLLVVCLCASAVQASPNDRFLQTVKDLGWSGDAEALLEHLRTPAFEKVARDPDALHTLAMHLDTSVRILTARGGGDAVEAIFEQVLPPAEALLRKEPNAQRAAYVWAALTAAQQRSLCLRGKKVDIHRWHRALQLALLVYAGSSQPRNTGLQVLRWVGELAVQMDADEAALLESADRIMQELLEANEGDPVVRACEGQLYLHKARAALTRRRKKEAKALVSTGLTVLAGHIEKGDSEKTMGSAHTALVTFARESNLGINACYRVEDGLSAQDLVPYQLPAAASWQAGTPGKAPQILAISQFGPEGRATRTIILRAFKHGQPYDVTGSGVGLDGRNAKAIAESLCERAPWDLDTAAEKRPVKKGRVGKGWPSGYYFKIGGIDPSGRWIRKTVSLVSSRARGHTIELIVNEYEKRANPDCEFLFVLSSLKIPR